MVYIINLFIFAQNNLYMDSLKSIEIIENMINEAKKSLHRKSPYFILWGILMVLSGIIEPLLLFTSISWIVWPIAGVFGGIISMFLESKESKDKGVRTATDRITNYTWGAFVFSLFFVISFALHNKLNPHGLILMLAGTATFISGGIVKFKPLIYGGLALEIGALTCAFVLANEFHGYVFSASIFLGYIIPGLILRKTEHGQA